MIDNVDKFRSEVVTVGRAKASIMIEPGGGPADDAAADAYKRVLLDLCKNADVVPTRTWLAGILGTSRNRLQRNLENLDIVDEYRKILAAARKRRKMQHGVAERKEQ